MHSEWLECGIVAMKERTTEPVWKKIDGSMFELPPIWTDYNAPGRGRLGEALVGGCWVAKNNLPSDDPLAKTVKGSVLDQLKQKEAQAKADGYAEVLHQVEKLVGSKALVLEKKSADDEEQDRLKRLLQEEINAEVNIQLEGFKYLQEAQEAERQVMAKEEVIPVPGLHMFLVYICSWSTYVPGLHMTFTLCSSNIYL